MEHAAVRRAPSFASRPIVLGAISLDLFAVLLGGAVALFAGDSRVRASCEVGPLGGLGVLRSAAGGGAPPLSVALGLSPTFGRFQRRVGFG